MYGRVDRGGSREGKKSLRKNKIAIVEKVKNWGKPEHESRPAKSVPAPPIGTKGTTGCVIDGGCNLVNRRFDNDQARVIQRAATGNVDAIIVMTNDFEKLEAVTGLTKQHTGLIYSLVGIHPDNVKRTNDKLFQQRAEQLKDAAVLPTTVGLFCGLDLSREIATHFPQERLLRDHFELAQEIDLPVVIVESNAAEKVVDLLHQYGPNLPSGAAIFNFTGSEMELRTYLSIDECPLYFIVTGAMCDPKNDKANALLKLLPLIPRDRLIIGSDAPRFTPQNIDDPYVREMKNEPSNMPWALKYFAESLNVPLEELGETIRQNTKKFYRLRDKDEAPLEGEIEDSADDDADDESDEETQDAVEAPAATPAHGYVATPAEAAPAKPVVDAANQIKYGCMMCRAVLVSSADVIPHEEGLDTLKSLGRARNDVEFDSSNTIFVQEVDWMKKQADEARDSAPSTLHEGKLDCPQCGAKALGRWNVAQELDKPVFTLKKKRLDVMGGVDTKRQQEDELDDGHDSDEDDGKNRKKKNKKKKVTKASNLSNMGNFRNKDFGTGKAAGSKGKKGKGKGGDDD